MVQARIFTDRRAAGRELADALAPLALKNPVVLALPRGGVPVGYEVAQRLGAPLDVLVVRKVGAPGQPELAMGAVAPGVTVSDPATLAMLGVSAETFERVAQHERLEVERRVRMFREHQPPLDLRGRTAILVDDGLATGSTMLAAAGVTRQLGAERVVVAVPVGAREAIERLREAADQVISLLTPDPFAAVGYWYQDFTQTDDAEVRRLLRLSASESPLAL